MFPEKTCINRIIKCLEKIHNMGYCTTPGCTIPNCNPRTPYGADFNPEINQRKYESFNVWQFEVGSKDINIFFAASHQPVGRHEIERNKEGILVTKILPWLRDVRNLTKIEIPRAVSQLNDSPKEEGREELLKRCEDICKKGGRLYYEICSGKLDSNEGPEIQFYR